ncbi:acyl-CoA thioesterase [Cellulomonas fimi]|uniref:Thioesterase superfamily protein n=1 Tax=Cellulomonas fimi (strain ATCC 484 / DSM 20113 / JCM 1341 / CCUG 24087 / LMG 16345 / NBRC 15513 / NCIMB 8980 / NCTC 7547 / NRS-133) TaxID=590998 RepID=F4H1M6_CELFA|nr:acyl-CoA thioesterase [Cellulomonas fimi]AEE46325.1 thioesterase superfamily protein [Cellulomonas fimi ATCC 484]NNH08485.1 acyl-CoA thioesterase [Cellulomonas fimi]VEH32534.1 acyl-CoA thioester hydrolase, YbgC/YbaW family [Cellulomonas fimi]
MTRTLHLAYATFRPRPAVPGQTILSPSVTRLRVHVGDLDLYRHVNNGVYLQYMDIGRAHYIADLGGYTLLNERGWYPVVAASTVKYRRSLTLGQRFTLTTRVLGWDERVVYLEQVVARGDALVARGIVAGRFLARDGARVPAPDVVRLLAGDGVESPELPDDVAAWARAVDVAHRPG